MGMVDPAFPAPRPAAPDAGLVTRLLREQVAGLAHLPVAASDTSGSSNWVFRLGDTMAVRMPRTDGYAADLRNELRWLPHVAGGLPVPVPTVVAVGQPTPFFPRPWSVVSWVEGDLPLELDEAQQRQLALTLGAALQSLHAIETDGTPAGAEHWGYRCGEPVTETIDGWADQAAATLADLFDPGAVREAWRRLREVPAATRPPGLVHTDVSSENVLTSPDGRLAGLIDFGGAGVGDPSVDLLYAWSMFDPPARHLFRTSAGADDATWCRARAWAFVGPGLLTLHHYRTSMPTRTERLTRMVEAVAGEVGVRLR